VVVDPWSVVSSQWSVVSGRWSVVGGQVRVERISAKGTIRRGAACEHQDPLASLGMTNDKSG
jgi:hypothetical protein